MFFIFRSLCGNNSINLFVICIENWFLRTKGFNSTQKYNEVDLKYQIFKSREGGEEGEITV